MVETLKITAFAFVRLVRAKTATWVVTIILLLQLLASSTYASRPPNRPSDGAKWVDTSLTRTKDAPVAFEKAIFPASTKIFAGKYRLPIVPRAQVDLVYSINPTEKYPAQGHIYSRRSSLSQLVLPSVLQTYWQGVAAMTSPHNPVKSLIRVLTRKIRLNPASERVSRRRFRVRTRRKLGVDNASATAGTVEVSADEMSVDYMDPQTHPPKGN